MGSVCQAIEETVSYLQRAGRQDPAVLEVHLYRPSQRSISSMFFRLPSRDIAVLDRWQGNRRHSANLSMRMSAPSSRTRRETPCDRRKVRSPAQGYDTDPHQVGVSTISSPTRPPRDHFTIRSPTSHLYLAAGQRGDCRSHRKDTIRCKFSGDSAPTERCGANKNSIKIIGDETDLYAR